MAKKESSLLIGNMEEADLKPMVHQELSEIYRS